MTIIHLPLSVRAFVAAHGRLVSDWSESGLRFTLDGRLVGDLAEAAVAKEFGLHFPAKRTAGVDLLAPCGKTVQVKASGIGKGPAFTPGEGRADHLIFLLFDFRNCTAEVAYNGPEAPVRDALPLGFSGSKRVSLRRVVELNLKQSDRLPTVEPKT